MGEEIEPDLIIVMHKELPGRSSRRITWEQIVHTTAGGPIPVNIDKMPFSVTQTEAAWSYYSFETSGWSVLGAYVYSLDAIGAAEILIPSLPVG